MSNKTTLILLTLILLLGGVMWYWQEDIEQATEIEQGESKEKYLHQEGFSFSIPETWEQDDYRVEEAIEDDRRFLTFYWQQENQDTEHKILEIVIQETTSEEFQPPTGWRSHQLPSDQPERELWLTYPDSKTAQQVSAQYAELVSEARSIKDSFTWEQDQELVVREGYITSVTTDEIPPEITFRSESSESGDDKQLEKELEIHPEVEVVFSSGEKKRWSWEQFADNFSRDETLKNSLFRIELEDELVVSVTKLEE